MSRFTHFHLSPRLAYSPETHTCAPVPLSSFDTAATALQPTPRNASRQPPATRRRPCPTSSLGSSRRRGLLSGVRGPARSRAGRPAAPPAGPSLTPLRASRDLDVGGAHELIVASVAGLHLLADDALVVLVAGLRLDRHVPAVHSHRACMQAPPGSPCGGQAGRVRVGDSRRATRAVGGSCSRHASCACGQPSTAQLVRRVRCCVCGARAMATRGARCAVRGARCAVRGARCIMRGACTGAHVL